MLVFLCNKKNNKETGLYSWVTQRSVLQRWGVTAVQLCLLASLLSLSLFPGTPPPPTRCRLHSLPFLLYPTYTLWLHEHTQTQTPVSGCRPLSLFTADPAGHDSCVTRLIPPETLRKSRRGEYCLVWESAFVQARVCPASPCVCTQSWFSQTYISLASHGCIHQLLYVSWQCGCWILNKLG